MGFAYFEMRGDLNCKSCGLYCLEHELKTVLSHAPESAPSPDHASFKLPESESVF